MLQELIGSYVFKTKRGAIGYFQIDDSYPYDKENVVLGDLNKYNALLLINEGLTPIPLDVSSGVQGYMLNNNSSIDLKSLISFAQSYPGVCIPGYEPLEIESISGKKTPGENHFRINRGGYGLHYGNSKSDSFHEDMRQYRNIFSLLDDAFQYIEPCPENLQCHGGKLRQIMLLACTEVEYLWASFLKENGKKTTASTKDYFETNIHLILNEYKVKVKNFPLNTKFAPFESWVIDNPTQSLPWYAAYNKTKHNRGENKADATLQHTIDAVAAIHILLEAQYGREIFDSRFHTENSTLFETIKYPEFSVNEIECPKLSTQFIETGFCTWSRKEKLPKVDL